MRLNWIFCALLIAGTVYQHTTGSPIRHGKQQSQLQNKVKKANVQSTVQIKNLQKKSNFLSGQTLQKEAFEDAKKKGTIRLSGPWHSDSGLDRNIDPQEDSYVKKVIASNEGLNFNKDMAEAGEVFDVNGIEDFYDKNALITYEVNGHEIPVHMKPKLTPQNQPMFPEYGHDSLSPSDIPASRTNNAPSHYNPIHKATTFFGMSLKDMPEYKVIDTPSVGEKPHLHRAFTGQSPTNAQQTEDDSLFSSRHRLASNNVPSFPDNSLAMTSPHREAAPSSDSQPSVDRFSSEYAQANSFGQEDVRLGNRLQGSDSSQNPPEDNLAGFSRKPNDPRFSNNQQYFDKSRNENYGHFAQNDGKYEQQARFSDQNAPFQGHGTQEMFQGPHNENTQPQDLAEFHHNNKQPYTEQLDEADQLKMHNGLKEFFNKPTVSSDNGLKPSEDSFIGGQSRGVGKEYDGNKFAPAEVSTKEHHDEKPRENEKSDDSSNFFEQLEKIDEQKQKNERDEQTKDKTNEKDSTNSGGKEKLDDKEKSKAKDKLLKILGDLTSKLKGMEAAVKDTHTDERRESSSMYNNPPNSAEHHQLAGYYEAKEQTHDEAEEHASREAESKMDHASENDEPSQYSNQRVKSAENSKYQDENTDRFEALNRPRISNHPEAPASDHTQDSGFASNNHESNSQGKNEELPDQISHLIAKYKQHEKPFIFNTDSIDYKGPHNSDQSDEANDGKDRVHHQPSSAHRLYERPIISAFYHDSKPDHYEDLDDSSRSHSENAPSDNQEVTPTQRDVSHSNNNENKDDESFDDKETKKPKKASQKADATAKSSEAENKPEIDDDLPDYNEVKDAAVFEENLIRKKYHSDPLRWSDDLSDEAQKKADDLAGERNLDLNKSKIPKGMNAVLLPLDSLNVGKDSADLWKKESSNFDFVSPLVTKKNTDFAQMVWKTAKVFGLGVAKTRDKENWIVVAKYDTPIISEYEKLKANIESDIPVPDPYSDIARR